MGWIWHPRLEGKIGAAPSESSGDISAYMYDSLCDDYKPLRSDSPESVGVVGATVLANS